MLSLKNLSSQTLFALVASVASALALPAFPAAAENRLVRRDVSADVDAVVGDSFGPGDLAREGRGEGPGFYGKIRGGLPSNRDQPSYGGSDRRGVNLSVSLSLGRRDGQYGDRGDDRQDYGSLSSHPSGVDADVSVNLGLGGSRSSSRFGGYPGDSNTYNPGESPDGSRFSYGNITPVRLPRSPSDDRRRRPDFSPRPRHRHFGRFPGRQRDRFPGWHHGRFPERHFGHGRGRGRHFGGFPSRHIWRGPRRGPSHGRFGPFPPRRNVPGRGPNFYDSGPDSSADDYVGISRSPSNGRLDDDVSRNPGGAYGGGVSPFQGDQPSPSLSPYPTQTGAYAQPRTDTYGSIAEPDNYIDEQQGSGYDNAGFDVGDKSEQNY